MWLYVWMGSDNDVKVQEYFDAMVHGKEHKEKE